MKKLILHIIASICFLSSCESLITEVPAKAVQLGEEKISVSCFISPQDTLVAALVTLSNPLYSERKSIFQDFTVINGDTTFLSQSAIIKDAKVILSNSETDDQVELLYEPNYKAYVTRPRRVGSGFRIGEGAYDLEVIVGDQTVKATTTVPAKQNDFFRVINEFDIETFDFAGEVSSSTQVVSKVGWTYRKNERALFRLRGGVFYASLADTQENPVAPVIKERVELYSTLFFDNLGIFDGSSLSTNNSPQVSGSAFLRSRRFENAIEEGEIVIKSVHTELLSLSEDYFQFYETYARNREVNPFVEPTSVFSNIEGGVGIFAGSNGVKSFVFYEEEKIEE